MTPDDERFVKKLSEGGMNLESKSYIIAQLRLLQEWAALKALETCDKGYLELEEGISVIKKTVMKTLVVLVTFGIICQATAAVHSQVAEAHQEIGHGNV